MTKVMFKCVPLPSPDVRQDVKSNRVFTRQQTLSLSLSRNYSATLISPEAPLPIASIQ
jgi:hypothetical protein